MALHPSTFDYLSPTPEQVAKMGELRVHTKVYCDHLERLLPEGDDKDYIIRKLRELAMWNNVAITRIYNGAPRT